MNNVEGKVIWIFLTLLRFYYQNFLNFLFIQRNKIFKYGIIPLCYDLISAFLGRKFHVISDDFRKFSSWIFFFFLLTSIRVFWLSNGKSFWFGKIFYSKKSAISLRTGCAFYRIHLPLKDGQFLVVNTSWGIGIPERSITQSFAFCWRAPPQVIRLDCRESFAFLRILTSWNLVTFTWF